MSALLFGAIVIIGLIMCAIGYHCGSKDTYRGFAPIVDRLLNEIAKLRRELEKYPTDEKAHVDCDCFSEPPLNY